MATQQEINDAVRLNDIINQMQYGYDSQTHAKRDAADFARLGGEARFNQLMQDPQVNQYLSAGSGNSLMSSLKTFGPYIAAGAGLAGLAGLAGMPITMSGSTLGGTAAASGGGLMAAPGSAADVITSMGGATGADVGLGGLATAAGGGAGSGSFASGISNALPAGGMVGTGGLSAADAAMMGVGGAGSVGAGTLASGGMTLGDLISNPSMDSAGQYITDNAGNLINAGLGMYSSYQAGQAAKDTAAQNAAIQAPWLAAGTGAVNQLSAMTQPGGEFMKDYTVADYEADPYNKWLQEQGNQAINRSAAAKGMLNSGNVLAELAKYGQGMAGQGFADQWNRNQQGQTNKFNRLASLAGTGQTSAQQVSSGNAFGTMGQADATSGMINSLTNLLRSQPQKTASSFW